MMGWLSKCIVRWFGLVSVFEFYSHRDADKQLMRDEYRAAIAELKAEHEAAMAELIVELNDLRNRIPVATQSTQRPVRVLRNFGQFKAAIEGQPKPIRIERTS